MDNHNQRKGEGKEKSEAMSTRRSISCRSGVTKAFSNAARRATEVAADREGEKGSSASTSYQRQTRTGGTRSTGEIDQPHSEDMSLVGRRTR